MTVVENILGDVRVSSVVEHSSTNSKVPSLIPGLVLYWGQGL